MSRKKVLIIDDDPEFTELTRMRLVASGYDVVTAAGGREGLRQAHAIHPDLIILDVVMPDMDGGDVGQALQADPRLRAIPVVYITSLIGPTEAARHNVASPGEVFLHKTASSAELLATLAKALATNGNPP